MMDWCTDRWTDGWMYEPEEPATPIGHHLMKTVTESLAPRAGCKAVKSPLLRCGRGFQGPLVLTVHLIKE